MNARLPQSRNCAAALSWGGQWGCGGIETGSRQRPENAPAKGVASTKRISGRHLITLDEIVAAVDKRLADWPPQMIDAWTEALRVVADDFRDDRPEVETILADIQADNPGRHPWPTACALLARDACRRGDVVLAMSAGVEVLAAEVQARRASNPRGGDALDDLLLGYVRGGFFPKETWDDLVRRVKEWEVDENELVEGVIAEHDQEKNELVYVPKSGTECKNIGFPAFRRRMQRLKCWLLSAADVTAPCRSS